MAVNVGRIVAAIGDRAPDREAAVWGRWTLTYGQLAERGMRLARVLQAAGLGWHGPVENPAAALTANEDIALLLMTNCPEYLEASVGGYLGRVAPANVNYRYTAEEVRYLMADSSAAAVIIHRRFLPVLAEARAPLSRTSRELLVLVVEDGSDEPLPTRAIGYELALANADLGRRVDLGTEDDLYVVYTGGTTGMPKAVLWRQGDFVAGPLGSSGGQAEIVDRAIERGAGLRALPAAPLMHGAAHWNALTTLIGGGTVVMQQHPEHLNANDVLDTVERDRCTSLQIVGDSFARPLLQEQEDRPRDLSTLRLIVNAGTILSDGCKQHWARLVPGVRIRDVMGSSEAGRQAVAAVSGRGKGYERLRTASVLSEDRSRELEPGDPEIGWLASTGLIPLGYLGDPAMTQQTFVTVGCKRFVVAGDRARLRADGSIELHGRDSVTINSGGEKIYAEEVEQALKNHPAVWDVVVVGRPSDRWGQEVVALVVLRPGLREPSDDELKRACDALIARYKWPTQIVRVAQIERTVVGKPDYRWAREQASGAVSSPAGMT